MLIGAHALAVNSTGFWIRFLGSKLKRREPSQGTVRANVLGFDSLRVYHFSYKFSINGLQMLNSSVPLPNTTQNNNKSLRVICVS